MDYYSSIAPGYDRLHGEEQDAKLSEFLAHIDLPANATILDVGCGTGRSILAFGEQQWSGIEPAQGLIDHAIPEAKPRIKQGAAESLPYPDASFDCVLSLTAMQNFDDPAQGMSEMVRVCRGTLLLSFLKKSSKRDLLVSIVERYAIVNRWEDQHDLFFIVRCGPETLRDASRPE